MDLFPSISAGASSPGMSLAYGRRRLAFRPRRAIHGNGRPTGDADLALWRMQLASRLLVEGRQVAAVASAVGYESEAAFSRAFKKLVGQAPATWRRRML
jgi:AraC-like DNA-binding protein